MSLSAALHGVVAVLRRRPSDLLPFYALGAATPAIARVAAFLGIGVALVYLETTGRLAPAVADLASRDLNAPAPETEPDAFATWLEGVVPALEPLFTPVVVLTLAAGFLLTLVGLILVGAVVSAGRIGACRARLGGGRGLTAGIGAARRHWLSFLGLFVLEAAIWTVAAVVAIVPAAVGNEIAPALGILIAPFSFLFGFVLVAVGRAVFAFAPVAVVVDDVGVAGSIRGAVGFVRRHPVEAGGYYLIALGALAGYGTVAGVLSLVEAGAAAAPLAFLVVIPVLELLKTGLFAEARGTFAPPSAPEATVREQLSAGSRRGLGEVAAFVRAAPGVHVFAVVLGLAGAAAGWAAAEPFVGALDASIVERLADNVPPAAAANFFGNNLGVAMATSFSGLALAVPAALSVWFNGFLLGSVARLEVDPAALAAFVAPHGVFEIPALVVSGALGLHLGAAWWRAWRGDAGRAYLADELERAFWVLVGVGLLLAVAALLEGFVSPYYWRPFV